MSVSNHDLQLRSTIGRERVVVFTVMGDAMVIAPQLQEQRLGLSVLQKQVAREEPESAELLGVIAAIREFLIPFGVFCRLFLIIAQNAKNCKRSLHARENCVIMKLS